MSEQVEEAQDHKVSPAPTAPKDAGQDVDDDRVRLDQAAKAVSAGLMAHPAVASAIVEISGSTQAPDLGLRCTLHEEDDTREVMGTIINGVVPNMELILDLVFASQDISFVLPSGRTLSRDELEGAGL
ncbi:hypothetical protein [Nesterenkonia sp. NBAIMH1]|uniref:hypothetical protein n=1 Tax=Nesterenkonia sp. NBAIMH1 TaxID=2600320 RepID=UPI001AEFDF1B|nr:hypothetical protein [Nesterenkonia sp. NBAIMH1]